MLYEANVECKPEREAGPKPSPLLSLPAELRNRIYELAVVEPDLIKLMGFRGVGKFEIRVAQPALTRACRQLRRECLALFYEANIFLGECHSTCQAKATPEYIDQWVEAIGAENRNSLKHLYLHFYPDKHLRFGPFLEAVEESVSITAVIPERKVEEIVGSRAYTRGGKLLRLTFG